MRALALEIIQSFCGRANVSAPSSLLAQTDPATVQLIELLYATCEDLRQARAWRQQVRTYSFDTTAGQASYPLPGDFYAMVGGTEYNDDTTCQLDSISDETAVYRLQKGTSGEFVYRMSGFDETGLSTSGPFVLIPTPTASSVTLSFEYFSQNTFLPPDWEESKSVTINSSWCNANSHIYKCSKTGVTGSVPPSHATGPADDGTAAWVAWGGPYVEVLSDEDACIFDYDLVKLGLRAKYREENAGNFQEAKLEFENKINAAVARMHPSRTGSFSKRNSGPRRVMPIGGWNI